MSKILNYNVVIWVVCIWIICFSTVVENTPSDYQDRYNRRFLDLSTYIVPEVPTINSSEVLEVQQRGKVYFIGGGLHSRVFLTTYKKELCALKIFTQDIQNEEIYHEALMMTILAPAKLLPTFHGVALFRNTLTIVSEFIGSNENGRSYTIQTALYDSRLDWKVMLGELLLRVAQMLKVLHFDYELFHGDLRDANIVIDHSFYRHAIHKDYVNSTDKQVVYFIDLSHCDVTNISYKYSVMTEQERWDLLSSGYVAPEAIEMEWLSPSADIYAFGYMLQTMYDNYVIPKQFGKRILKLAEKCMANQIVRPDIKYVINSISTIMMLAN